MIAEKNYKPRMTVGDFLIEKDDRTSRLLDALAVWKRHYLRTPDTSSWYKLPLVKQWAEAFILASLALEETDED